jgi:flagellar motility protein MotE (MotC chaperone)
MRFRLLPIAVCAATALLGVKVTELWRGVESVVAAPSYARPAMAQAQPQAQPSPGPAPAGKAAEEASAPRNLPTPGTASQDDPMLMTQSEIDILQKLAQRRVELESWGSDLSMREQLLKAAELRIEGKLTELKGIQGAIKTSLKQHDDEQEAKLKSLVKIYETMKPKEAARIFDQLEMPVLLDVIERMKETKAAPVMAAMESDKAKKLTTELAKRRRLAGEESQRVADKTGAK